MRAAQRLLAGVVSCAFVLASCASKPVRDDKPSLAGKRVEDASAVRAWHEGEQEAGVKSDSAAASIGDAESQVPKEVGKENANRPAASVATGWKEVFPFVRVDAAKHEVEFDAEVPAYAYVGKDGVVYLEVLVCTRDTREHEALLVTGAKASDVHAALLMAGLVPGAPGGWEWKEKELFPIAPRGEFVEVVLVLERGGARAEEPLGRWVKNVATGALLESRADEGFVFAGSGFVTRGGGERYAADGAGTLVGLATFGTETIAWRRVFSPESSVDEPVWAVDRSVQPEAGTKVKVVVRRARVADNPK